MAPHHSVDAHTSPGNEPFALGSLSPADIRRDLIGGASVTTPYGQRRVTYADYIASGRALGWVEERIRTHVMPLYANTHTEDSATGALSTWLTDWAANFIKTELGAPDHAIVFCGSGCTAAIKRMQEILGIAVPSSIRGRLLDVLTPAERPVVFVGPYEHHSNEVSWRETIAEVVEVALAANGRIDTGALERALADPRFEGRTKIGSFSAASNVTGLITDAHAVAEILHRHGALAFFDFAASAPYVDIDIRPGQLDGFDAVFLSPHKLLGGPGTPGILVFDPVLYQQASPTTAGGGTVMYVNQHGHEFIADVEVREDAGTPNIVGKIRAALAFAVKRAVGPEVIAEREHDLIGRAMERLRSHPMVEILGPNDAERLAIASFLVRSPDGGYLHPRFVVRLLNDLFGIQSRGGCSCAGPYGHHLLQIDNDLSARYQASIDAGWVGLKPGWTRLNFNYFIADDEFDFLLSAIEFVADHGAVFVADYDFDWHTGAWTHPADTAHPADALRYFAEPAPHCSDCDVPYREYLAEARLLARDRSTRPSLEAPQDVPSELVFFTV